MRTFLSAVALSAAVAALPFVPLVSAAPVDDTQPTVPDSVVQGDVGDVRLVNVDGRIVNRGDGSTPFFIVVPDRATCPGDSANDQWRVHSFLVPEADDVLPLWFGSTGPEPPWEASRYPMFENQNGLPLSQMMLARNASPGLPGVVEQSGETSLRVHAENGIVSGRYRIGIACAYFRQTTQFWDLVIEVTAASDNEPTDLKWKVVEAPGTVVPQSAADEDSLLSRGLMAFGALVIAGVVISARRSRRRSADALLVVTAKESK